MDAGASRERQFEGIHCSFTVRNLPGGVVLLKISGTDTGELGDAPMQELKARLAGAGPAHLFIDARDVRGASIEVSADWAAWLRENQAELRVVSMLTGSCFIEVTADFVRRFAALQGLMRIYTEPAAFEAALAEALGGHSA